jgi:small subunit ribosomal protein S11
MTEKEQEKVKKEEKKSGQNPEALVDKKAEKSEVVPTSEKEPKEGEKIAEKPREKEEETTLAKKKKKKIRRQVLKGQVHVQCTYNNTIVTFTDLSGKVLAWCSAGSLGFKGAKKATPYAATQIVNTSSEKVEKYGLKEIEVYVKGVGSGREASIRALANKDFEITLIKDLTPIPHNGCRPRKPRRV